MHADIQELESKSQVAFTAFCCTATVSVNEEIAERTTHANPDAGITAFTNVLAVTISFRIVVG